MLFFLVFFVGGGLLCWPSSWLLKVSACLGQWWPVRLLHGASTQIERGWALTRQFRVWAGAPWSQNLWCVSFLSGFDCGPPGQRGTEGACPHIQRLIWLSTWSDCRCVLLWSHIAMLESVYAVPLESELFRLLFFPCFLVDTKLTSALLFSHSVNSLLACISYCLV